MQRRDFMKSIAALSVAVGVPIEVAATPYKAGRYGNFIATNDWPPSEQTLRALLRNAKECVGNTPVEFIAHPPGKSGIYDPYNEFGVICWRTK